MCEGMEARSCCTKTLMVKNGMYDLCVGLPNYAPTTGSIVDN